MSREQAAPKTGPDKFTDLRRRAEEAMRDHLVDLGKVSSEEAERLLHELQVYQVELEMQNEELRRVQQELEASRDRYVDLYDFSPVGYLTLSEQGMILEANLTIVGLLGVGRDRLIEQPLSRFIVTEDQDIYYSHRQQLFDTREPQVCELRMARKDSAPFWARIEATIARDSEGQPVCRATVSDVSEQKRAENELRQKDFIIRSASSAIATADLDGAMTYVNSTFLDTWAFDTPEEVIGRPFTEFWILSDKLDEITSALMGEERKWSGEIQAKRKDGMLFDVQASAATVLDEKGNPIALISTSVDIAERVRAEQEIQSLTRFPGENRCPVLRVAQDGTVLYANEASAPLLMMWDARVGQVLPAAWRQLVADTLDSDEKHTTDVACEERIFSLDLAPVTDAGYVNIYGRDITEHKWSEDALRESGFYLEKAQEIGKTGHFSYDPVSSVVEGSSELFRIFDVAPDQPLFEAFASAVHPKDGHLIFPFIDRAVEEGTPYDVEHRVRHKNGSVLYVCAKGEVVCTLQGERMIGIVQDITERKQAEEALRDSYEKYYSVIENANVGLAVIQDGRRVFNNSKMCEMIGYTEEEYAGNDFLPLIHPEDRSYAADRIRQHLMGEEIDPEVAEMRVLSKSGDIKWISTNSVVIQWEGKPAVQSFVSDITERKWAEKALQESEERFAKAFHSSPTLMAITRMVDGHIVDVNDSFTRAVGYRREELVGHSIVELGLWAKSEQWSKITKTFQEHKRVHSIEVQIRAKSGDIRTLLFSGEVITLHDELHLITVASDITERKRADEALRESEENFRSLVTNANDGILIDVGDEGTPAYVNERAAEIMGYSVAELLETSIKDLLHPDEFERVTTSFRKRLAGERVPRQYETVIVRKDGTSVPVEVAAARTTWQAKPAVMAVVRDITERMRTEDALRQSNRRLEETLTELRDAQEQMIRQERLAAVGQLSAGIAHDFRTLLTTIILYAQMASHQPDLPPRLARNIKTIIDESNKAADLVQQILDFSSHSLIQVQLLDLQCFIQDVIDILERMIPENIQLSLAARPEEQAAVFTVRADPGRIQQVLINLATNARDAMPRGGELCFELSCVEVSMDKAPPLAGMGPGAWVCLTVSDTGTGMTAEVRAHLFEPFFTTKEVDKGTGLGLAQVHGIIRQHEGYIDVETEVGRGTTFRIYLPACAEKVQESKTWDSANLPLGRGETILLVEDNEALRKAGQSILESLGYHVLVAANGREALVVYETGDEVDLVITDVVMPRMGGKELVQEMRRSNPNLKALCITGYTVEQIVDESRDAGFLDVIHKPFEVETLARATHRALNVGVGRWWK